MVLILILMECLLRDSEKRARAEELVLILILMECLLRKILAYSHGCFAS